MGKGYFAGIDSGSTSTDVVILNKDHEIVTSIILPTGAGAAIGADRALAEALKEAGLQREDIDALVTTGYGRTAIKNGDKSITEITCHARGAHFLDPEVRTVIDIGGQDSKVIRLDENGAVANFVMNDKCSAGTGKFLEVMTNRLGLTMEELSDLASRGNPITISSMCTVFAESEVISLIGRGESRENIAFAVIDSIVQKVVSQAARLTNGQEECICLTGGLCDYSYLKKSLGESLKTDVLTDTDGRYAGTTI